jgi:hypothetical protein
MAEKAGDAAARASARAQKQETAAREGAKARAAYDAQGDALRARTARLRELRLAKEATEEPVAPKKAAGGKKGAKTKTKAKSERLADWLDTQTKEGRRK